MCLNRKSKCDECGKDSDALMTCHYVHDESTIDLCPTCLKEDGSFCLCCGQFCAGFETFEFHHPGYCDNCWSDLKDDDYYGDPEEENEYYDPNFD